MNEESQLQKEIKMAVKELDLSKYEHMLLEENKPLSPMMTAVSFGGIVFGSGILLNTVLNRKIISKSSMRSKYLFGFSLVAMNLYTLKRSIIDNRKQ